MDTYITTDFESSLLIHTLPSPCGAGKTYSIAREAHKLACSGKRVLIAQPTTDLIDKTLENEILTLSPEVDCVAIHTKCTDIVLRDVKERFKKDENDTEEDENDTSSEGQILPIRLTHTPARASIFS